MFGDLGDSQALALPSKARHHVEYSTAIEGDIRMLVENGQKFTPKNREGKSVLSIFSALTYRCAALGLALSL